MSDEQADLERHDPIPATRRDVQSPVWDMSQERVFIETLLNQRFNFFLVFFSLVLAGAVNAKVQLHFQLVLTLGAVVTLLFALVLRRSQEKLDLIIKDLQTDPTHPVTIIDNRASGPSRRWYIGYLIPGICSGILIVAAVLSWLGCLAPDIPQPCP